MTKTTVPTYTADEVAQHRRDWLAALRSGELHQGRGALRVLFDDQLVAYESAARDLANNGKPLPTSLLAEPPIAETAFCCLGVAEQIRGCRWRFTPFDDDGHVDGNERIFNVIIDDDDDVSDPGNLTEAGMAWLGVVDTDPHVAVRCDFCDDWHRASLATLNDGGPHYVVDSLPASPWTFTQIADAIERQGPNWTGDKDQAQRLADAEGVLDGGDRS